MIADRARIKVIAGRGGHGCVSFRREKYVPKGGPDGGDGGHGGSVIFRVNPHLRTLLDFQSKPRFEAEAGANGSGSQRSGKSGDDLVVDVPAGTMVTNAATEESLVDLVEPGATWIAARGGRGGKGNMNFATPTRQAPRHAQPGKDGETKDLRLELRLIADVGLVGFPNIGKSTLLARLSAARPKIADYPFTTLDPQLGIVQLDADRIIVVADIPGLIEGAQHGAGLGHNFLRHIERTKVIVHLLDLFPMDGSDPAENYRTIRRELESFSPALANKRELIAANKMDLAVDDEALDKLRRELPDKEIFPISGVSRRGLEPLLEKLWQVLQEQKAIEPQGATLASPA